MQIENGQSTILSIPRSCNLQRINDLNLNISSYLILLFFRYPLIEACDHFYPFCSVSDIMELILLLIPFNPDQFLILWNYDVFFICSHLAPSSFPSINSWSKWYESFVSHFSFPVLLHPPQNFFVTFSCCLWSSQDFSVHPDLKCFQTVHDINLQCPAFYIVQ